MLALFDLDNTLVNRQHALADWAASFRARHGLDDEAESWLLGALSDRATPAHFARVRDRFRLPDTADALWSRYRTAMADAVVCRPAVLSGLEKLRAADWRIGVATNGATDIQWAKLRSTGIADRVDAVCVSEEAGARKPALEFFREALRRCGGDAHGQAAWMVGDNPVNDIAGGRAAGLRTVWIDRGHSWPEEMQAPDRQVGDAKAAVDLLLAHTEESM